MGKLLDPSRNARAPCFLSQARGVLEPGVKLDTLMLARLIHIGNMTLRIPGELVTYTTDDRIECAK